MQKKSQTPETYNAQYTAGGFAKVYHLSYRHTPYLPLFKSTLKLVTSFHRKNSILDVGCGNGTFGHMVTNHSKLTYRGFDFSEKAIELAKENCSTPEFFSVGDARDSSNYEKEFECLTCTEVLEHLEDDLSVIRAWPSGKPFVCSVPNFDSVYHERFFLTEESVLERYGDLLNIQGVEFLFQPLRKNLSFKSTVLFMLKTLVSKSRIKRVIKKFVMKKGTGWFVFYGTIK